MFKAINRIKAMSVLVLVLAAMSIAAVPIKVSAAAGNPAYCDAAVDRLSNQNIGTKVPVILVHGFNGNTRDWGSLSSSSSFAGKVNAIPGVTVAHLFSYNTYNWVDHQDSGPRLAKTVDCISRLSAINGGKGKVIVIGYSMGGLVARDALSHRSSDGQRSIADEAGQVITIGSPHEGTTLPGVPFTLLAAFAPGSPELSRLPRFPTQTAVHAIAGDVERIYLDRWGRETKREQPHDDTLVTVSSAIAGHSSDISRGGGQKVFNCQKQYYALPFLNQYVSSRDVPCEHGRLIQDANNGVRPDTVDAIQKYVASLSRPPFTSLTVASLTTNYDNRWTNFSSGMGGPNKDSSATDTTNGVTCTNCTETPPPQIYPFLAVFDRGDSYSCGDRPVVECMVYPEAIVGPAPPITVGGRTPDYSARYREGGYYGTSLAWCFEEEKVCLYYRRGTNSPQLELSQAVLDVFARATWSTP